jgi:TRAP-type C4-dicarboxylate transport system permease large subunit
VELAVERASDAELKKLERILEEMSLMVETVRVENYSKRDIRFHHIILETAKITTMLFIVLVGAIIFSNFVSLAGLPQALSDVITHHGVGPMGVIANMMVVYFFLGCFLDSLAMILLTVPIFFPIVSGLGFDAVWFGIVVVMVSELALITPPVGMNLFVIKSTVENVKLATIYRGIIPFAIADVVRITIVILVPGIPLLLPRLAG